MTASANGAAPRPDETTPTHPLPPSLELEWRGSVAVLRLNRAAKRNALDTATVTGLEQFVSAPPAAARAIVLDASGDHFSAGLDLSELTERDAFAGLAHSRMWHRAFDRIEHGTLPVITVLKGAVVGGGLELAASTHIRVAEAQHVLRAARGPARAVRRRRRVGAHPAADRRAPDGRHDADRPRPRTPRRATRLGLSHYLTGTGEGLARALELAEKVAANSAVTNFAVLQALPRIAEANPDTGLLLESLMAAVAGSSERGAGPGCARSWTAAAGRCSGERTVPNSSEPFADDVPDRLRDRPLPVLAGRAPRPATSTTTPALHRWSVAGPRRLLVRDLGVLRASARTRPYERVLGRAGDARARSGSPAPR